MRLISKRQIFARSSDRLGYQSYNPTLPNANANNTGNFLLNCGQQVYLGEAYEYKVYIQSYNIRNDFNQISAALKNNTVVFKVAPSPTYNTFIIPDGAPDVTDLVQYLKTWNLSTAAYDKPTGKLSFNEATQITFDNTGPSSAYAALGMAPGLLTVINPGSPTLTTYQVTMRAISDIDLLCSTISEDRYETSSTGLQQSQRVTRSPIVVPFMGQITYFDTEGANGTFVSGAKDTLDQFVIQLYSADGIPLVPGEEWSLVIAVEVWSDVDRNNSRILGEIAANTILTAKLLQLMIVGLDPTPLEPEDVEMDVHHRDIPSLVPFGYPLPYDPFAGNRAPYNAGI